MSRPRLLLLLFVSLGLALTYAWLETPRQQRVTKAAGTATKRQRFAVDKQPQENLEEMGLDFSGGEKLAYKKPKRDLFRPLYEKPKAVAVVKVLPPPEPVAAPVMLPPPPMTRPAALPKFAVKPIPPLTVLGYLQKNRVQTVFLSSLQGDIYVVKQGDRFADGLLVRGLTAQEVMISRGLKDAGVSLPLGGKKAGRMPVGRPAPIRSKTPGMYIPKMKPMYTPPPLPLGLPATVGGEHTVDP